MKPTIEYETRAEIGRKIRAARKRAGFKLLYVASQLGVTESALARAERGENALSLAHLLQLPRILRCRITDLLPESVVTGEDIARSADHGFLELRDYWEQLDDVQREVIRDTLIAFARER